MSNYANLSNPSGRAEAVVPSDTVNFTVRPRGIYVGVSGDVTVVFTNSGTPVTFTAVPAGSVLPIMPLRVNATDTDATDMVAFY